MSWRSPAASTGAGPLRARGADSTPHAAPCRSSLVAKLVHTEFPHNSIACIGLSAALPKSQLAIARDVAAHVGIPLREVATKVPTRTSPRAHAPPPRIGLRGAVRSRRARSRNMLPMPARAASTASRSSTRRSRAWPTSFCASKAATSRFVQADERRRKRRLSALAFAGGDVQWHQRGRSEGSNTAGARRGGDTHGLAARVLG